MNLANPSQETPVISVVVTIGARRWRALRCLEALTRQVGAPPLQILVMDSEPQLGAPDLAGIEHVPCADCPSIPHAKAEGFALSRAPIVAFLEDHCVPQPGWAAAIASAFAEQPDLAAVAYAFGNLNPVNWVSRSFLLLAYGPWMAPVASGPIPTPSWMNVAYARRVLCEAPNLVHWFSCEGLFLHQLKDKGAKFWQAGEAHVKHLNHPFLFGSARDSAVWQRIFAAARVEIEDWSWPRRMLYAAAAVPCSPSIIIWRLTRRLWTRPEMRARIVSALPLLFFVYTWGAFSEALGYIAGSGDASRLSFEIETGDPRGEAP